MSLSTYLATRSDRCTHGYAPNQGCPDCTPVAPTDEWSIFKAAIREVARPDGTVHQGDVRPLIRGRIAPKHVGVYYRRARAEGLLVDTGEREPSNDFAGRNADKLDRIYEWVGGAS